MRSTRRSRAQRSLRVDGQHRLNAHAHERGGERRHPGLSDEIIKRVLVPSRHPIGGRPRLHYVDRALKGLDLDDKELRTEHIP